MRQLPLQSVHMKTKFNFFMNPQRRETGRRYFRLGIRIALSNQGIWPSDHRGVFRAGAAAYAAQSAVN